MRYLTDWRMALARDHLRSGDLSMTKIARAVGYSSPYAFAAAFRRHHGEPPGVWRQRDSLRVRELPGSDPHAH
jgi:AraC-like DNA-binding protein